MTADRAPAVPLGIAGTRRLGAGALTVPALAGIALMVGLSFAGGGVAPEQWQPLAVGMAAVLAVLAAVGALPAVPPTAWPALGAFSLLVVWSALSLLWSDSRDATVQAVARDAMLWAALAAGMAFAAWPRSALVMACALALAGIVLAVAIEIRLLRGLTTSFAGPRLSWPINYANAAAALLFLPLPCLVTFAASAPLRPVVRALFGASAGMAGAIGLMAQSRGGTLAVLVALGAMVWITTDRARLALTMLAVVVPAVCSVALYGASEPSVAADAVTRRGVTALGVALAAGALVGALAMADRRGAWPFARRPHVVAATAWGSLAAVALVAFVVAAGNPAAWVGDRWHEFTTLDNSVAGDASRFGSATSNRYDYWRVSARTLADSPIGGVGAGAFAVPWFAERSIDENVTDAHSWQMGSLAETGLVGFALLAAALAFALRGVRRARAAPGAWPTTSVALGGAGVYFVAHASVDWLFAIPALALPGFLVLGSLATGGALTEVRLASGRLRAGVVVAALLAAAITIPPYISTAETVRAQTQAAVAPVVALRTLDRATDVNPFAVEPLVLRSTVLSLDGDLDGAVSAAEEATDRGPNSWAAWVVLAQARLEAGDDAGFHAALGRAVELNPRSPDVIALQRVAPAP